MTDLWLDRRLLADVMRAVGFAGTLFVAAMIVDGGAAAADLLRRDAPFEPSHFFVVEDVKPAETVLHERLRAAVESQRGHRLSVDQMIRAHRIDHGRGVIVAWRHAFDLPSAIDEEHINKLTVFLADWRLGQSGVAELGGDGYAMWSRISFWGDTNCLGIARDGTIRFRSDAAGLMTVDLALTFAWVATSDLWTPNEICPDRVYRNRVVMPKRTFDELSVWDGRASGVVTWGEHWPVTPE